MKNNIKGRLIGFNEEYIARFIHYRKRITRDDIIFGSFEKSGRTWVRFFIASYINDFYKLGFEVDWSNFTQLTPGTMFKREGLRSFPILDIAKPVFSHRRTVGRYFPGRRVVFITRNFLDILVSSYYFHKHRGWYDIEKLDVNEFAMSAFDTSEAISRINYFSRQLLKARCYLVISYEDLIEKEEETFRKLIKFTTYEYDEEVLKRAMAHSSFGSMQKSELKGRKDVPNEKLHARQGAVGTYLECLDTDVISHIQNLLEKNLTGILREYYLPGQDQ